MYITFTLSDFKFINIKTLCYMNKDSLNVELKNGGFALCINEYMNGIDLYMSGSYEYINGTHLKLKWMLLKWRKSGILR